MRLLLLILILFTNQSFAQIKYVKGISATGKDANYSVDYLPTTKTVQTQLRYKSDSLRLLYERLVAQGKAIKILQDSLKIVSVKDTIEFNEDQFLLRRINKHHILIEAK